MPLLPWKWVLQEPDSHLAQALAEGASVLAILAPVEAHAAARDPFI